MTEKKKGGAPRKLTHAEIALVVGMAGEGKKQVEIAAFFKVSQPTISSILKKFGDSRAAAKARLHAEADNIALHAVTASMQAASHGDGSVSLELLDRLDVAPKKRDPKGETGSKIMIVVGQSNPAALPPGLVLNSASS